MQPDRHDAYYNLGNLYFAEERFEEAALEYRRSLDRYPDASLSWLNLGLAARSLDQLDLSRSALQRCLQLDPLSIRAWCNYGITCHQLERFDQAIEAYYKALSLDQEHGPPWLISPNRSMHPIAILNRWLISRRLSLTLQEDCGDALFNLALTRLLLGEFELGWELYECRFKTRSTIPTLACPRAVDPIPRASAAAGR